MIARSSTMAIVKVLLLVALSLFVLGGLCDKDYSMAPDPVRTCTDTPSGEFCE